MLRLKPLSLPVFLLLVSVFIALTGNLRFIRETLLIYPPNVGHNVFLFSLFVALLLSLLSFLALLCTVLPVRLAAIATLILAAFIGHFGDQLGAVIDLPMITNVMQTDPAETGDLLNTQVLLRVLLLGLLPAVAAALIPLQPQTGIRRRATGAAIALLALALLSANIFAQGRAYSVFLREHKTLRFYINPLMAITSATLYVHKTLQGQADIPFRHIAQDANIEADDDDRELVIVVVGETVRADHFSLNGYPRPTNPELSALPGIISFSGISSCGTSTAISVPCMFSINDKRHFDRDSEVHQENVLDVLQRVGVNVLWRDNNSSSKGVADRVSFEDFRHPDRNPLCDEECRDEGMLSGLQDYLDQQSGDVLIVLHQMGNHGPAYFKRYPASYEYFSPACQHADLSRCSPEEITNAYDNAIRYTDHFLAKTIEFLQANTPAFETTLLYVGDHGESLGEQGIYLHGAPYFMAPEAQTHVPVIVWMGESADLDSVAIKTHRASPNSHDAVFASLLELFEVSSAVLPRQPSLFTP